MADSKPIKSDAVEGTLPPGGTTGQIPAKVDGTDYNYGWADASGAGLPVGGVLGQVLTKQSATDDDADWESPTVPDLSGLPVTLPYTSTSPLDGIISWFGTSQFTRAYLNPVGGESSATANYRELVIEPTASSTGNSGKKPFNAFSDSTASEFYSNNVTGAWWQVDFKDKRVALTALAVGGRNQDRHLRNWTIQESNDGITWTDLATMVDEGPNQNTFFAKTGLTGTASRYIRIQNDGINSSGDNFLIIGEIEMWGTLSAA